MFKLVLEMQDSFKQRGSTLLAYPAVKYRVVIRFVFVVYSISIVNGAAVIDENCCVHPANGTHIICCCKSVLLNVACYLAKLNK
jgi:hypothetical protein